MKEDVEYGIFSRQILDMRCELKFPVYNLPEFLAETKTYSIQNHVMLDIYRHLGSIPFKKNLCNVNCSDKTCVSFVTVTRPIAIGMGLSAKVCSH